MKHTVGPCDLEGTARGRLRLVEIAGAAGPLPDMLAEEDFGAVLAVLYRAVMTCHRQGGTTYQG